MKYPVRGPSPIAVHGPIAVHSAIFSHLFWTVYFTTQWSTITGPSPIAVHSYNGPRIMKWKNVRRFYLNFFFFLFFFFWRTKGSQMKKKTNVSLLDLKMTWKFQTKSKEKTGKCTAMEAFGPFLSTRNSVQVQLSPKKKRKKTLAKKERMHISPKRKVKKTYVRVR